MPSARLDPTNPGSAPDRAASSSTSPLPTTPGAFRSTGFGQTGFGSTVFDALPEVEARERAERSVFDVCHVGVVLRALLFVHAVIVIGTLFVATNASGWILLMALGSGAALPGVLLWLLAACGLKRLLGELPGAAQATAAIALGAVCALAGAAPTLWLGAEVGTSSFPWLAPVAAGAGFAAVFYMWLQLRAQATLPADTTARLAELQSRIRPHFLFNTLNTALALVRLDPARAEGVLEDLAELFRVAISDSAESVPLADEVALAQRYLAIEQIRFGDRLNVSWELEPEAGAARVPPLLLQPLIENAVRHGIEPAAAGGSIRVRTRVKGGRVQLVIVNTVSDAPSRPGNGIALRNVRERLHLLHDVASQFDARRDGAVYRVQIAIPI
jgi:two-component system, LytTR family, sensor histidine kinase AlgZ